jgi:hypothetical protein
LEIIVVPFSGFHPDGGFVAGFGLTEGATVGPPEAAGEDSGAGDDDAAAEGEGSAVRAEPAWGPHAVSSAAEAIKAAAAAARR